jgi:hypothetical protein
MDKLRQPCLAQSQHLGRGVHLRKQRRGGFVDALIRRLRTQHHRHQQLKRVGVVQLGFRCWAGGLPCFKQRPHCGGLGFRRMFYHPTTHVCSPATAAVNKAQRMSVVPMSSSRVVSSIKIAATGTTANCHQLPVGV